MSQEYCEEMKRLFTSKKGKHTPFCRFLVFIPVNRERSRDLGPSRMGIDKGGRFFSLLLYSGGADETLRNWDIYLKKKDKIKVT